jgi:hypothetical protein
VGLPVSGTLRYDLRYSEGSQLDGPAGSQQQSFVSGDASYSDTNKRYPFSLQYGGGYGWVWAGQPSAGDVFQHLALSQGMAWRSWSLSANDSVSYTFQTPTTGFSGIPGTGEPIGGITNTTPTDQTVLTVNTRTLDNIATASAGHRLDQATSLSFGGSVGNLHFMDKNGQDTDTLEADAGVTHRLDAQNSLSGGYSFSQQKYVNTGYSTQYTTVKFGFMRRWNRRISTSIMVGPTWSAISGTPGTTSMPLPNSTSLYLSASIQYTARNGAASLSYLQGDNGGSGYFVGAKVNSVDANYSRSFGKRLTIGSTASYMRTASLFAVYLVGESNGEIVVIPTNVAGTTNAWYGGAQASWKLGRYLGCFANYTALDQSTSAQITAIGSNTNILSGMTQQIGFGISYSPREIHFKR